VVFALFVGLPAVIFWLFVLTAGLGVLALVHGENEAYCNIATVPIHGVITSDDNGFTQLLGFGAISGATSLIEKIEAADEDPTIEAILIDIDSPGGTPVAADDVMRALESAHKPTVALIRDLGASAAYWIAAGADHIVASPISSVGSIGVTMSYVEIAGANEEEGSRWINLASGEFKDAGNPDRRLREEEQEYFQSQVNTVHDYMVDRIASMRPTITREQYSALADGRVFLGTRGLELGLVDALGGAQEVRTYLAEQLGALRDDIVFCESTMTGLEALFD